MGRAQTAHVATSRYSEKRSGKWKVKVQFRFSTLYFHNIFNILLIQYVQYKNLNKTTGKQNFHAKFINKSNGYRGNVVRTQTPKNTNAVINTNDLKIAYSRKVSPSTVKDPHDH